MAVHDSSMFATTQAMYELLNSPRGRKIKFISAYFFNKAFKFCKYC